MFQYLSGVCGGGCFKKRDVERTVHFYNRWYLLVPKCGDAGKDWGQEEKGTTEDEMAGWHHRLNGHEFEWTLGVGDGQGGLACCDSWGRKESDTTKQLNWAELNWSVNWTEVWSKVNSILSILFILRRHLVTLLHFFPLDQNFTLFCLWNCVSNSPKNTLSPLPLLGYLLLHYKTLET